MKQVFSVREAVDIVCDRRKVESEKAKVLLFEARLVCLDKSAESFLTDLGYGGVIPNDPHNPLAALGKSARQGASLLAAFDRYGKVSRDKLLQWLDGSEPKLEKTSEAAVHKAMRAVLKKPAHKPPKGKRPNVNELIVLVRDRLKKSGRTASWKQIRGIANEPEFKAQRNPVGKRLT